MLDAPFLLTLAPRVQVSCEDDALIIGAPGGAALRAARASQAVHDTVRRLAADVMTASDLSRADPAATHYLLLRLNAAGLLSVVVAGDGWRARLDPLSHRLRISPADATAPVRLSRFAVLRREVDELVIESPLGHGQVTFSGVAALTMVSLLAQPCSPADLSAATRAPLAQAAAFIALLVAAGAVGSADADGNLEEDRDEALRQWEAHDLLFHSRSRAGRRRVLPPFRFAGEIDPLPALKPTAGVDHIPLPEPSARAEHVSFKDVCDRRRSVRSPGAEPLTLEQLSTFLDLTARTVKVFARDPTSATSYEAQLKRVASGGATHSIEVYLAIGRVAGLETGLYHYRADAHVLARVPGPETGAARLLDGLKHVTVATSRPDVAVTLATRFARLSWKYSGIAYALALKDAGAMMQQMAMTCAALGLSGSPAGAGDSDLFAEVAGLPYAVETSVGEFALSSG